MKSNIKILRNKLRQHLFTIFRGRKIRFKSKEAKAFNFENEEEKAMYEHWMKIYGGLLYDDTANVIGR